MMKRILTIALLLIGLLVYFYFSNRESARPSIESKEAPASTPQNITSKPLPREIPREVESGSAAPRDGVYFERDGELAIFFEDIILGTIKNDSSSLSGFVQTPRIYFWNLPIPYAFEQNFPHPERALEAIQYFNEKTPVRFVPANGEEDLLMFVQGQNHCRSFLGKMGGPQPIFLSPECGSNEILHELMHAIGFIHEQSRSDRDAFVELIWENIEPKEVKQFQRVPDLLMEASGLGEFDFQSIMLYKPTVFSKSPRLPTMRPKSGHSIAPMTNALSRTDLERLERIYGSR
jgi:hypothetical protein